MAEGKYAAKVEATMDRKEALVGAEGVVTTILAGDVDVWQHDILIPKKYGVDTNVGDTRGPSGIFRYLRTINPHYGDRRGYRPLLPQRRVPQLYQPHGHALPHRTGRVSAHRDQRPVPQRAGHRFHAGQVDRREERRRDVHLRGHQPPAFYLDFRVNGEDAYPLIRKAITERPEVYNEEIVRNEMFLALGYYVTESSGHNSEYNAWFRKRPDLIEKYCLHGTGWNPGEYAYILNEYRRRETTWKKEIDEWFEKPLDLARGQEYAAYIFNAIFGDGEMFKFNGNVRNFGLVDNLPYGCCVEVPVLASKRGLEPIHVGKMPPQLALLSGTSAQIEEMVVEARSRATER